MTTTKILLSATTVILVVSAFLPHVHSIRCFQCNSYSDPGCNTIVPINNTHSPYLRECETSLSQDRPIFCRKIVQHITAFESDETRIIRKCSYEPSEKDCYHFEDEDHTEVVCQCFEDACNRGDRLVNPGSLWRTALPVTAASLVSYILAKRL